MLDSKKLFINIDGRLVPVTEEVYLVYYRSERRMRYFERDIKTGKAIRDDTGNITGYKLSKEDSLDRLIENGADFVDGGVNVEDSIISAIMMDKLYEALGKLPASERQLIEALFFSNGGDGMTEREYAKASGIPQQTINSRKSRILGKLKKLFRN